MLTVCLCFRYRGHIVRQFGVYVMHLPVYVTIYQLALGQASEMTLKDRSRFAPAPPPPLKENTTKHGPWSWKLYLWLRSICSFMHSMFPMCLSYFTFHPPQPPNENKKRYNVLAINTNYWHLSCFVLFVIVVVFLHIEFLFCVSCIS